ncbi:cytochrome c [bacterium]|nr:cytochrome c [bacterium]
MKIYSILLVLTLVFFFSTCKDKDATPQLNVDSEICDSLPSSYEADIQPIMESNCALKDCHGDAKADGKYLRTYEEVKTQAERGEFLRAIRHEKGADPMPQGREKLSDEDIRTIECWIFNNYPE